MRFYTRLFPSRAVLAIVVSGANWLDHVLPRDVPLRQYVLTLPFELRARLAYDGKLLGAVCRIFTGSVLGWYRRKFAERGVRGGQSGAITVIQRLQADLRLNPHLHALLLDGVFAPDAAGELVFHPLPSLTSAEVADLLQVVRVLGFLARRGVIDDTGELGAVDDAFTEREPALAALARASVRPQWPRYGPFEFRGALSSRLS